MLALCLAGLVSAGLGSPAGATQATGHDVPGWANNWSWTYATVFHYTASGTDITVNENVTFTNAGPVTFAGQPAYKLNLNGTVTSGSGSADTSAGHVTIDSFSGTVTGTRYVRRSDLALLEESQHQVMHATGHLGILSTGIDLTMDLTLTPDKGWRNKDFPLNAGDSWQNDVDIHYTGGYSYDAGSLGGSGSAPFDDHLIFQAPSTVTSTTISAGGNGSLPVDRAFAQTADQASKDDAYWSPTFKNDAKEILQFPVDGGSLVLTRTLSSASIPGSPTLAPTITPSLTCAGGTVTVAGALSTAASGVPVSISLDQSQTTPGQLTTVTTTTGVNGAYSATLTAPAQSDGLQKNGSRANWGVLVSASSLNVYDAATLVVTPKDCSSITYTGPSSGAQFGSTSVSAQLTDLAGSGGAAGRTVTFSLTGGSSVNAVTDASGTATANLPIAGPPRSTTVIASFAGAADLEAASRTTAFTVTKAATGTTVAPSSSTVTIGDPVTFTASVSPSAAGGTVQFKVDGSDFGAAQPLSGGTATSQAFGTGTLTIGNHTVQAVYNGDADYLGSTSAVATFRVRNPLLPSTTTEIATPSSVVTGQTVTLAADVAASGSDPVTGSVTFSDGATTLGEVALDGAGHAELAVSDLAVGSHGIVASYSGDDVYNASSSAPASVSVAKADVQVGLSVPDDHTVTGQAVSVTATVGAQAPGAGTPTGTVQLVVDGNDVGSAVTLVGGAATFDPLTTLGAGDHTVAVSYSGDPGFRSGTASATQHVTAADTTTSVLATPSPSAEDQPVTITATVAAVAPGSGAPTGTVLFVSDGEVVGAAPLSPGGGGSQATIEISTLAPGSHTLSAWFAGNTDFHGSQSADVSHTVIEGAAVVATTTSVSSSHNPSTYGELVTFTATVSAADDTTPTGTVQFSVDGADFGDPVEVDGDGVAVSATLASPDPGDHTVIAAYQPTAGYSGSGDVLTQTVADADVSVALDSSDAHSDYGQAVSFTATVGSQQVGTGTPTGYVQFRVDGAPLGDAVALVDGVATSPSVASLEPGSHAVTALYSGDIHFNAGSAALTQDVAKVGTTTALTVSPATPTFGDTVVFTATVTPAQGNHGVPTGTVTFRDGTTVLATVPVSASGGNATASVSRSDLGAGTHHFVATYSGSEAFAASSSATVDTTVARKATTLVADAVLLRLNPLLGINVGVLRATLTTSAGPLPGQVVVFSKGTTTVCSATTDATGLATCTPSVTQWLTLALGGGFTAEYAGSPNYLPSSAHGSLIK